MVELSSRIKKSLASEKERLQKHLDKIEEKQVKLDDDHVKISDLIADIDRQLGLGAEVQFMGLSDLKKEDAA